MDSQLDGSVPLHRGRQRKSISYLPNHSAPHTTTPQGSTAPAQGSMPAGTSDTRSQKVGSDVRKPYCGDSTFFGSSRFRCSCLLVDTRQFRNLGAASGVQPHMGFLAGVASTKYYLLSEYYHQLCQLLPNNAHPDIFILHLLCIESGVCPHAKPSNRVCIALQRDQFPWCFLFWSSIFSENTRL